MGNREIVQGIYDAFAKGDVPSVLASFDERIEWTEAEGFPLYGGTFVGPQQVVERVFVPLTEIFDGFAVTADQLVADGDTVVALGTYSGTAKATGIPFEVKLAHVWTLREGTVVAFQQHTDTLKVKEALGS